MFDQWQAVVMFGRFKVRPYGDDGESVGVWDGAANGWRSGPLSELEARALAGELELQYDEHGPRSADTVRRVAPAQPIERATWEPAGALDAWVRDRGQWWGRVRDADGRFIWVTAAEVRPLSGHDTRGDGSAPGQQAGRQAMPVPPVPVSGSAAGAPRVDRAD